MSLRIPSVSRPLRLLAAGALLLPLALRAQQPRPEGKWTLMVPAPDSTLPPVRPIGPPGRGEGPGAGPPGMGGPAGPGSPAAGGGGMSGGRSPGRYTRDLTEKDILRMRQTMRLGYRAPVTVEIRPREKLFVEVDSGGVEHRWPIGQTIESAPADSGRATGRVETSIKWKGDALVVQHRVDGGGRVRESYGVGLDGSRMVVFVEVDAGGLPASFRRQYQRADEGAVSPPGGTASSP